MATTGWLQHADILGPPSRHKRIKCVACVARSTHLDSVLSVFFSDYVMVIILPHSDLSFCGMPKFKPNNCLVHYTEVPYFSTQRTKATTQLKTGCIYFCLRLHASAPWLCNNLLSTNKGNNSGPS